MRIVLAGIPNAGKTTVFNHLTGQRQHIGNFPGVTVAFRIGRSGMDEIIDLPGLYSLQPSSEEEQVAVRYLRENPPDGIINCMDVTNLRRSLALTLSLMELEIPMILAANMVEECVPAPDLQKLEEWLGIPVFEIRRQNAWAPAVMLRLIRGEIQKGRHPTPPVRGSATEKYRWLDRHNPLPPLASRRRGLSEKLDRLLLHPLWGTLIFALIMGGIFDLTFHRLGPLLASPFRQAIESMAAMAGAIALPLLRAVVQGAILGVGSVFSFLPSMMLLFFFLAILEDSGYMVRICYLAENIMARLGLSGKSIVPLLIGFGCSVPAVLSARTLGNEKQRRLTIRLIPFFSCGAKLPVYGMLASILCPEHPYLAVFAAYLAGILAGLATAALSPRSRVPLIMEKPPYRLPKAGNLWHRLRGQTKSFIEKAFTILLAASVVATILQQFTPALTYTASPSESILALIAGIPAPLFRVAGLGDWRLISALLAGLFAKESIVSVLAVVLPGGMAPQAALPFLAFALLYPPCVAALSVIRRETGWKCTLQMILLHLAMAFSAAVLLRFLQAFLRL